MTLPQTASAPLRLLVSVRDAGEAECACAAGLDLVDAKDPERGALGALPPAVVGAIRARVAGRAVTSAVAGEPEAADLAAAVRSMAETGIDYVKVALRPDLPAAILAEAAAAAPGPSSANSTAISRPGAMIDTAAKDGRRLPDLLAADRLAGFTAACRAHGLLSGLAGSLAIRDIPALAAHRPDYLGFRGGLCRADDRRLGLDPDRLAEAVRALAAREAA